MATTSKDAIKKEHGLVEAYKAFEKEGKEGIRKFLQEVNKKLEKEKSGEKK